MDKRLEDFLAIAYKQPKELHFESSSRCNGKCITCPREGMTRFQGEMSDEIFYKGVDEAADLGWQLDYFHYHLDGEPLFLPIDTLVERINYTKKKLPGNPVHCFFTNSSLLTPDKSEKLLNSYLDKIVFSVDGGNKRDFEAMRPGLKWETVVENIRTFMRKKREMGRDMATQTAFIPTWENRGSLNDYYAIFRGMGIDDVGGSGVNNIGGHIDAKKLRLPTQYTKGNPRAACWRIFIDLSIQADGNACACCQDVRGECIIGDLKTQNIGDIWQGKVFQDIRDKHLKMDQTGIPLCETCDYMESFVSDEWWPQ